MKTNLQILAFEHKVTKAGKPFVKFQTEQGWMNSFDSVVNERIMQSVPATHCVEVEEKPNAMNPAVPFRNITKIYADVVVEKPGEVTTIPLKGYDKMTITQKPNNHTTMYVSYAKDIFCHLIGAPEKPKEVMEVAINLVKQAQEAFS